MLSKIGKTGAAASAVALVGSLTASCGFADPSPFGTVQDFLIAWQVENFKAAASNTTGTDKKTVMTALSQVRSQLDAASLRLSLDGARIVKSGAGYDAQFTVRIDLGQNGDPWTYKSQMHLSRISGTWKVVWSPSIIHPQLTDGERFAVVTTQQERKPILDASGRPLLKTVSTMVAGVYPGQLQNDGLTDHSLTQLAKSTGMDPQRLIGRVNSAPPDQFLPLVTLERSDPGSLAQLHSIPGLRFQNQQQTIHPSMAGELVGSLGTATSERLQQVGAPYRPGDTIGISGLQLLFQRRLASTPQVQIVVQEPNGANRKTLATWTPKDTPQAVETFLDPALQKKAEYALSGLKVPASLVAIRPADGEVLAVANVRTDGHDLALEGRYPPGMTFGLVSAEALVSHGQQLEQKLPCGGSAGGQSAGNQGQKGDTSFEDNFAKSCPAMMQSLAPQVDAQSLAQVAAMFGIGRDLRLAPVPVFSGQAPAPATDADKAAMMFGEGKVLVSPLSMALVAGAVNTTVWRPPLLVKGVTDPLGQGSGDAPVPLEPQTLDGQSVVKLQRLMRRAVASGAAKAANVPNTTVNGMVSQVDYGQGKTVSWFVGYKDGLAVAIAIEGRTNAAAIAYKFLR